MVRKASPSKASPVFTAPPHRLDSEARQELWTLLGYSAAQLEAAAYPGYKKLPSPLGAPLQLVKADNPKPFAKDPYKAALEVETALGLYKAGLLHLNQIPGPADYRLAFRPVRDLAASTLNQICSWSDYYRDQFKFRSVGLLPVSRTPC